MATYPKTLKNLVIHTLLAGASNVVDTADDPQASMALAQFEHGNDLVFSFTRGEGAEAVTRTITIPYHAVQYIEVTKTVVQVEKAEAYDCERSCCE